MKMQSKRTLFQLSWWTLLAFVAITGICFGAKWSSQLEYKRHAIERVRALGGELSFDYQWSKSGAFSPNASAPGSKLLKRAFGDDYAAEVIGLQLYCVEGVLAEEFSDADAKLIAVFDGIRWLVLMDTRLTDDGLRHFTCLEKLERLDLEGSKVTQEGVDRLREALPNAKVYFYQDVMTRTSI